MNTIPSCITSLEAGIYNVDIFDINNNGQKDSSGIAVMISIYKEYTNNVFISVTIVPTTIITKRHLTMNTTKNKTIYQVIHI